ncbi:MAG: acyl-CoA dehydrogenase [Beijerinckiaceae bacterium]|nr:acyl-CoA dehydrogenase [Beijerinckiaceae bacterium]
MTYRAPVADMLFAMRSVGMDEGIASGLYADLADGMAESVLEEAGKFANDRLAPLNKIGDRHGTPFKDGVVTSPPGWREAYQDWAQAGWNSLPADPAFGGQGLPLLLNAACSEMWNAANMAFALNPMLSGGAIEALLAHGSAELQNLYLAKIIAGEWTGTMNLTEPQAGSDLAALRTKAVPQGDGTYRITGQKIYITYGEHELTENIVHLVLARLPDAPAGTRGISLFLVPKFLVNADGSLGARNDVRCSGIEHKLGIHASPTCTMIFGDEGGATGWLIGQENKGLACMFTMMNNARLNVGLQGVAIADRAYQHALWYAQERRQGKAPGSQSSEMSPIIEHPDVKRMLMEMRSKTAAARAICYATANALDRAHRLEDAGERKAAHEEASLLIPVAKAFSTDIGVEVASLGVQVHGGMGFVEETGAAQYLRDARIAPIYEGTNGIQAIDLATRKLPTADGATVRNAIAKYRHAAEALSTLNEPGFARAGAILTEAVDALDRSTEWMLKTLPQSPADALAGATPYLRLYGVTAGGAYLARSALAARVALAAGASDGAYGRALRDCRFFVENMSVAARGLETSIVEGAEAINGAFLEAAE